MTSEAVAHTSTLLAHAQRHFDVLPALPSSTEPQFPADLLSSIEAQITQLVQVVQLSIQGVVEDEIDEGYIDTMRELWIMIKSIVVLARYFRPWLKMNIEQTGEPWWVEGFMERIMPLLESK